MRLEFGDVKPAPVGRLLCGVYEALKRAQKQRVLWMSAAREEMSVHRYRDDEAINEREETHHSIVCCLWPKVLRKVRAGKTASKVQNIAVAATSEHE